MDNYYAILELDLTASKEEVKKSYRRLSKTYHPDFGGNTSDFLKLSEAYETLSDDSLRSEYDLSILREELVGKVDANLSKKSTKKERFTVSVREYFLQRTYYFSSLIPLSVASWLQITRLTSQFEISNPLFIIVEILVALIISKVVINALANASDFVIDHKYLLVLASGYVSVTGILGTFSQFCGSVLFTCLSVYIIDYIYRKMINLKEFLKSLTSYWHYYVRNK